MASDPNKVDPQTVGRTTQIVTAALIMGVLVFAGVALTIRTAPRAGLPIMTYLGVAAAALLTVVRFFVPAAIANQHVQACRGLPAEQARERLAVAYQVRNVVTMSLLEGASFFNLVAFMLEGQWLTLGVVAVLVTLMAVAFPSQGQFESWAAQVQRDL